MFLYLSHLIETKNVVNTDEQLKQAGVLYFNFKSYVKPVDDVEKSDEELYEGACKKIESCPEATGRVNDTEDILGAMKDTETASYTPYTDDQKGRESGVIISDGLFSALRKFSLIKTAEFGSRLMSGDIGASPLDSTCKYCDFAGICGMAKSKDDAYNSENKEDEKKMKEKLDEIMNGGEGK
jgi:ATP-dependent helicase/DNAse subunit B